jgi:hypothetical protein
LTCHLHPAAIPLPEAKTKVKASKKEEKRTSRQAGNAVEKADGEDVHPAVRSEKAHHAGIHLTCREAGPLLAENHLQSLRANSEPGGVLPLQAEIQMVGLRPLRAELQAAEVKLHQAGEAGTEQADGEIIPVLVLADGEAVHKKRKHGALWKRDHAFLFTETDSRSAILFRFKYWCFMLIG